MAGEMNIRFPPRLNFPLKPLEQERGIDPQIGSGGEAETSLSTTLAIRVDCRGRKGMIKIHVDSQREALAQWSGILHTIIKQVRPVERHPRILH